LVRPHNHARTQLLRMGRVCCASVHMYTCIRAANILPVIDVPPPRPVAPTPGVTVTLVDAATRHELNLIVLAAISPPRSLPGPPACACVCLAPQACCRMPTSSRSASDTPTIGSTPTPAAAHRQWPSSLSSASYVGAPLSLLSLSRSLSPCSRAYRCVERAMAWL